jgi:hypothetical protein
MAPHLRLRPPIMEVPEKAHSPARENCPYNTKTNPGQLR